MQTLDTYAIIDSLEYQGVEIRASVRGTDWECYWQVQCLELIPSIGDVGDQQRCALVPKRAIRV